MRKLNIIAPVALLAALLASALFATPAYAASYVVNTLNDDTTDDAFCTLREAIGAANFNAFNGNCGAQSADNDIITFSVSGTITLASQLPNVEISVFGRLTIDGGGTVIVSGNNAFRVLSSSAGYLTLQNITIAGGGLSGGGNHGAGVLNNLGTLNIINSTFSGNNTGGAGGGVYNNGTATITNSTFSGNSSSSFGGGGIYSESGRTLTISNSTFSGNSATGSAVGGAIVNLGTVTITNSTFSGNTAASGGAINSITGSTLTITDSTLSGNSATSTVNSAGGGAIFNGGIATITNSTLSNNSLTAFSQFSGGAGISNFGTLTLTKSTLSNNSLTSGINTGGGGISNYGTLTIGNAPSPATA